MKTLLKSMQVKAVPAKTFRASRLGAACVLALSGVVATSAMAQTVNFTFAPPAAPILTVNAYTLWANNLQLNLGPQTANNSTVFSAIFAGPGGVTPVSLINNTASSLVQGNLYTGSSIGLLTLNLSLQSSQTASLVRTATTSNASARITETGLPAAVMVLTGNTLSATTTQNQSTQVVSEVLPGTLSTVAGSVVGTADNGSGAVSSATAGSINVGSYQAASGTGASSANVTAGTVLLDLKATDLGAANVNLAVNDNAITAAYQVNNATNQISAAAGSSALLGSLVVANAQANVNSTSGTGSVAGSSVRADYRDGLAGNTQLTGDLSINNNTIRGTAAGNTAGARSATGQVLAGNSIVLADGVNVAAAGAAANSLTVDAISSANLTGGLIVLNGQRNIGSTGGLTGSVADGQVTVSGDNILAGGSITSTGNTVASAATGNLAGNLISTNATSFVAAASAGNAQSNFATPITASNTNAAVTVGVGFAGSVVTDAAVTLNTNTIGATAEGNIAATTLSLAGTNLTSRNAGTSSAVADTSTAADAANVAAGASATNIQGNYGTAAIGASLTDADFSANFFSQTVLGTLVTLSNTDATVNSNAIQARAMGNSGASTVALSGTTGDAQAGVSNVQSNASTLNATVSISGVHVTAGGVTVGSAVALNSNSVAAQATANMGSNNVSAAFTNLNVGPGAFVATTTDLGVVTNQAALGIASNQQNTGAATVSNTTPGSMVVANVGGIVGVVNSDVNVNNNTGSAASTGNQVANTVSIDVANLVTQGGAATQIGGISNLQVNTLVGSDLVTVGGGLAVLIGAQLSGPVATANVSVASNAVAASSTGNTAANRIAVNGGNLASTAAATGAIIGTPATGATTVNNEFALVNRQSDTAVGRSAIVQSSIVGIDNAGAAAPTITGSNLTVQNNRVTAEARNNNAANAIAFTGATNLDTGAGLLNLQSSNAPAAATVASQVRLNSTATTVDTSNLALTGNTSQALAVGSSAANSINAAATNLSGNALIPATTGGSSINNVGLTTVNAGYGVANVQAQTGAVSATAVAANQIGLTTSAITGGAATLTGNAINAVAQATSATNNLNLSGTNATGLSGAVASRQNTTGAVTASQALPVGIPGAFLIQALSTNGTPLAVSNNTILVSAGQNEAFNTQSVLGTTVSGGGFGNNDSSYVAAGTAATGSDFTVLNVQGGTGNVSATSTPGVIGVQEAAAAAGITGSSVSVNDNIVTARATMNNASNALNLETTGALNATGAVSNVQNVTGGAVTAAVAAGGNIGVMSSAGTLALDTTAATVSGNLVTAQAGANTAVNALNAVAGSSIAGSGANSTLAGPTGVSSTDTTFAVLNFQSNAATVEATIASMTIGISTGAAVGSSNIDDSSVSVSDNIVTARATMNNASNALNLETTGALNATGAVSNVQNVTGGAVTAAVAAGGNIGVMSSAGTLALDTTAATVSGNLVTAQAGANTAVNALNAVAGSSIAGSVAVNTGVASLTGASSTNTTFAVLNFQSNNAAANATITSMTIGISTGATGSLFNTTASVQGNQLLAYGYGNSANNTLGMSALPGTLNQATAGINNVQINTASITAAIASSVVGLNSGGSTNGGAVIVSNNTSTAQSIGNSATNRIVAR